MFESIEVDRLKRKDYINWNDYFMAIALLSAQRSKDPNTQVGACIVNVDKKIVGVGYNGFPNNCSDNLLPWDRTGNPLDTKYIYVCHSEMNAILNATKDLKDCTIYCTLAPCNECAKMIIQSGIKEVIFKDDVYHDTEMCIAARKLFDLASIKYKQYIPSINTLTIQLKE